jgi:hypothetical protein
MANCIVKAAGPFEILPEFSLCHKRFYYIAGAGFKALLQGF